MYRNLVRRFHAAQHSSLSTYEPSLLISKCDKASVCSIANESGVKFLSTTSVGLCEKKNDVASSNQDDSKNGTKELTPTEPPPLIEQKADADSKVIQMVHQNEQPAEARTDDGNPTHSETVVRTEQLVVPPNKVKADAPKNAKESLLDLLGAMKVDVTNKRQLKSLKFKQSYESVPASKPANMESTITMFQQATEASTQSKTLDPELIAATSAAAATLPNHSQAESELLRQLRKHEALTEVQKKGGANNLGVIIADMKVRKNLRRQTAWPANQIRFDDDGQGYTHDSQITSELGDVRRRKNLFSGKRLNIFSPPTDEGLETTGARPTLWDMEFANQLSLLTNQIPRNGFDEIIQWTKEGKLWQYPVNNEAGLEEEATVSFHEHVFLEKHLEDSFPHQGPVRHFMELVVTGLSKNPYLTVQQKKEHIFWFRDYFLQKEEVLREAEVYLN